MVVRLAAGGAALLLLVSPAVAAPVVDDGPLDGTHMVRELVPATGVTRVQSRTIFLNRKGATLRPGVNDSYKQTSSIVTQPVAMDGWDVSEAKWTATVACMRETWAKFDVAITETDPGDAPHVEALFGGSPSDIGRPANVAGIAPFATDCGIVENAIVFAFTDNLPADPQLVCEVMSQEIGHAYGLDHELLAADPMSYLPYAGKRTFQDTGAACGEKTERPCGLGATACRAQQNSQQILLARLGAAGGDGTAPTLVIMSPAAHADVDPGFTVQTRALDDIGVTTVALYVDGVKVDELSDGPFDFATDENMPAGAHTVMVEARDANDNITVRELDVVVTGNPPWFRNLGCSAGGGSSGFGACALALVLLRRRRR
jgi:hypothetical protein